MGSCPHVGVRSQYNLVRSLYVINYLAPSDFVIYNSGEAWNEADTHSVPCCRGVADVGNS